MLKQVLAKKQQTFMKNNGSPPDHCIQPSMLHQLLSSVVSGPRSAKEECVKYQEAVHVDAFLEVTPLMAATECISKVVLHPLEHLGDKLGLFFSGVLSSNSYLASVGVLTFSFCILVLFVVTVTGYSIKLPFISIEPTAKVPTNHGDRPAQLSLEDFEELKALILSLKSDTKSIETLPEKEAIVEETKEEKNEIVDISSSLEKK